MKRPLRQATLADLTVASGSKHPRTAPAPGPYLPDRTEFGPSNSGESGSWPEGRRRQKADLDAPQHRMGVFRDGADYWGHRTNNFNRTPEDSAVYRLLLGDRVGDFPQMFKGFKFYLDSAACAAVPHYHLLKLITLHGGTVQPFYSKGATHVLCHRLSASRSKSVGPVRLSAIFPRSNYIKSRIAVAHYDLKDFDEAAQGFEDVLESDPYRLDSVDMYSNILYVKGDKTALSTLAHRAVTIDKFKPETNCIIGNYYSLKSQHEKAVVYFQRALRVDPAFISAWTLMGHELVELKNTHAAIDAYRHAVDICPRDYRAWYGLGQTYEILQLYYYALYYFRKATNLRPLDSRMWCAMAGCFENLKRSAEAIQCYHRAEAHGDDSIATSKLAQLYQESNQPHKAAQYYAKFVSLHASEEPQDSDKDALLFLAKYYKQEGCLQHAEQCCIRLLNFLGPAKEDGKRMLAEIQGMIATRAEK